MKKRYNWQKQREKKSFIALEDGSCFYGVSVGAESNVLGELVFNTGLTGYQEILSDPSYAGQIVAMTYPEIGNYGIIQEDMETLSPFTKGFIVHKLNLSNNWRADTELHSFLKTNNIPALEEIDVRALTLKIRSTGTQKAFISTDGSLSKKEAVSKAIEWEGITAVDYVKEVSTKKIYKWDTEDKISKIFNGYDKLPLKDISLVAYDFGIKRNILRHLRGFGMDITVVPATTSANEVLKMNPDGIFLSNGPADPRSINYVVENIKQLIGKKPIMGICLGHQLLGLALGSKTFKLKFGHHGCNHPIKNLLTGKIEITSQNHNYASCSS